MDQFEFNFDFDNDTFVEQQTKRKECSKCHLHPNICICQLIPNEKSYDNHPQIIILQDQREALNKENTVKLIDRFFKNVIMCKKKLPPKIVEQIKEHPEKYATVFPSKNAKVIDQSDDISFTKNYEYLIMIDGTWDQARSIYHQNEVLQLIDTLILTKGKEYCQYSSIRKEIDGGMSTFEATIQTMFLITNDEFLRNERERIMKEFTEMRLKFISK